MPLGKSPFGSFFDKITSAVDSARAREAAFAAAASGGPMVPATPSPAPGAGTVQPSAAVQITPTPYGDMFIIPVVFAAAGDLFVLERPKQTRVLLIVYNSLAANNINFAFGRAADAVSGIPIAPGGNLFLDVAVPQNDLHLFSPIAGTVLVAYMNT